MPLALVRRRYDLMGKCKAIVQAGVVARERSLDADGRAVGQQRAGRAEAVLRGFGMRLVEALDRGPKLAQLVGGSWRHANAASVPRPLGLRPVVATNQR